MKPVVAIVGRPNVGKSTLFNRLTGARQSIVHNEPNLTRDRIYGEVEWQGKRFSIVDTGGLQLAPGDDLEKAVQRQAMVAIEEADLLLFLVNGRDGATAGDYDVAEIIRKSNKNALLVVNKIDDYKKQEKDLLEFYALGLGEPLPVSAEHGLGTGDILDLVVDLIHGDEIEEDDSTLKVAIIGRPNVGKSSLVNAMLGKERVIVDTVPGTTRDAIDSKFSWEGNKFTIIDTAGMRRRSQMGKGIAKYSALRSYRAVDRAEVVLAVFDASTGIVELDKKIAGIAHEQGKGLVVVFNKMDISKLTSSKLEKSFLDEVSFINYAPLVFTSAKKGEGIMPLLETVKMVEEEWKKRIKTGVLNELIADAVAVTPPPSFRGKRLKIYYGTQAAIGPPTFVLFVNDPKLAHFSYIRYLENQIRKGFGFIGCPLWIKLRRRGGEDDA